MSATPRCWDCLRAADGLQPAAGSQLTPIPLNDAVLGLSAILLDESSYEFIIMAGRREVEGLPCVGEYRLIQQKAIAWLELSERKQRGAMVDAKDVR